MSFTLHKNNDLALGDLGITDYPFTLMAWVRVPDEDELMQIMRVRNSSTGSYHRIHWQGDSSDTIGCGSYIGGGALASATIAMTREVWHHVLAIFAAEDERTIYLDGGNSDTNTTTKTFDGLDKTEAGNTRSTVGLDLADVAVLDSTIDTTQIGLLAAGISILALPAARNMLAYQSCIRRVDWPAWENAATASETGTLEVTDHPPIWYPQGGVMQTMPHILSGPWRVGAQQLHAHSAVAGEGFITGVQNGGSEVHIPGIEKGSTPPGEVVIAPV